MRHDRGVGRFLRNRPLRHKLGFLLGLCAAITAATVSVALFAMTWWSLDEDAAGDVAEISESLAFALRAPIAFEDPQGMRDVLAVMNSRSQVLGVWVVDRSGRPVASWGRAASAMPSPGEGGLLSGQVTATRHIVSGDFPERLGAVTVAFDLSSQRDTLAAMAATAVLAVLAGFALSVWVSGRLSRRITAPVLELAETATEIASGRTFDRRLHAVDGDEVGRAVDAFNAMIDEVERRGEALAAMNRMLEKQVEEQTRTAERAEAASLAKTRFLSNMSHELRSPLNGVIGAAQLLQDTGADPDRRDELVRIIRTSGTNLLGLIDSILDLARIESGAMALAIGDGDFVECVAAAMATAAVPARAKGLQMAAVVDPTLPAWRRGDMLRLRQVLLNLLGNAVKFTLQGEVVLRVKAGQRPGELMFQVSDTGIGMEPAALRTIFDPFRQADDSTTRRFGGSGLGLAICRQVVQLMNGTVDVASEAGEGSCFTVTVPLPVADSGPPPPLPDDLLVHFWEPHEASAEAFVAMAARLGHRAVRCHTADDACRAARGGDGWLFIAADTPGGADLLAACGRGLPAGHVVAMTGADAGRPPRHGPASVTKPVARASLAARLSALTPAHARVGLPACAEREEHSRLLRVLVVED
ncbi:MAG: ATP-binding protein, partial [Rhizobacter sp.]